MDEIVGVDYWWNLESSIENLILTWRDDEWSWTVIHKGIDQMKQWRQYHSYQTELWLSETL